MSTIEKSVRQFECPDDLWQKLEAMAHELECPIDALVTTALRRFIRSGQPLVLPTPAAPGPCLSMAPRFDDDKPDPPLVVRAAGVDHLLRGGDLVIGAGDECDVILVGENVAAKHALVENIAGLYFVVDLGAPAGILCRGQRIARKRVVSGDEIVIGEHRVTFRFVE